MDINRIAEAIARGADSMFGDDEKGRAALGRFLQEFQDMAMSRTVDSNNTDSEVAELDASLLQSVHDVMEEKLEELATETVILTPAKS